MESLRGILPEFLYTDQLASVPLVFWMMSVLVVLLTFFVAYFVGRLGLGLADRIQKQKILSVTLELRPVRWPLVMFLFVILNLYSFQFLVVPERVLITVRLINKIVMIQSLIWLSLRFVDVYSKQFRQRFEQVSNLEGVTTVSLLSKVIKFVLVVVAVLLFLQNMGVNVTAVMAGLGVGGIAVALAAQKTIENLFGGMMLLLDRPARVGDFCRFNGQTGTLEKIGLRSTKIRTLDRTLMSIPNSDFSSVHLENFAERERILFRTTVGVRYESTKADFQKLLQDIRDLLAADARIEESPRRVRFVNFGAYALEFEIFAYVRTNDFNDFAEVREELLFRVMDLVESAGLSFAFPSQTLYLAKDSLAQASGDVLGQNTSR